MYFDTAGQEKYRCLINNYYKNSDAFIIVFDLTDIESFNNLPYWIQQINENTTNKNILLLGNKKDLEKERKVTK